MKSDDETANGVDEPHVDERRTELNNEQHEVVDVEDVATAKDIGQLTNDDRSNENSTHLSGDRQHLNVFVVTDQLPLPSSSTTKNNKKHVSEIL